MHVLGWSGALSPTAGYLCALQWLVAGVAAYLPLSIVPAFYNYVGVFLTLTVVWLVTSARLALPLKPLLAVAVVQGREVLGTMANVQWIVPIGVFVMLFMRPGKSPLVLVAEIIFAAVVAVTGPFSIFLAPLFMARLYAFRDDPAQRLRLGILTLVITVGAVIEATYLAVYHDYAFVLYGIPHLQYPLSLWLNLPVARTLEGFGRDVTGLFHGTWGVLLILVLAAIVAWLAALRPYRSQKISMLLFSGAIAVTGMIKYRESLPVLESTQRYFYASSIFIVWFACCCAAQTKYRNAVAIIVVIAEIVWVSATFHSSRPKADADLREWKVWAQYIPSGLAFSIPIDPPGWFIKIPTGPKRRPFGKYNSWIGNKISDVVSHEDPSACQGDLLEARTLAEVHGTKARWATKGWGWNTVKNEPVELVAVVDPQDTILGFGLAGFSRPREINAAPERSGWISIFLADAGVTVRGIAILDDGKMACPLGNALPLQ